MNDFPSIDGRFGADGVNHHIDAHRAVVIVDEDQQSLAIGKKGQNVRLASKLCGWDIDIKTRAEFDGVQDAIDERRAEAAAAPQPEAATAAPVTEPAAETTTDAAITEEVTRAEASTEAPAEGASTEG